MLRVIFKRLIQSIPILIAISIFTFLLMQLSPGKPYMAYITPEMDLVDIENIKDNMGLNDRIYVQYFRWLGKVVQGDLGKSMISKRPVLLQIQERLPATLGLMGISLAISMFFGILLGVISAAHHGKFVDQLITLGSYASISMPGFWFAIMLVYLFSLRLGWLPSVGMRTIGVNTFSDLLLHSIMPIIVSSSSRIARIARYVRSSMLSQLNQDYVKVAKAYGASRGEVLYRYVLKNSLLPVITIIGYSIPSLVTGSFIVESIFGWPGMGQLAMKAIQSYDYPLVLATTLFSSFMLVVGNLLADVLYLLIDPRIER